MSERKSNTYIEKVILEEIDKILDEQDDAESEDSDSQSKKKIFKYKSLNPLFLNTKDDILLGNTTGAGASAIMPRGGMVDPKPIDRRDSTKQALYFLAKYYAGRGGDSLYDAASKANSSRKAGYAEYLLGDSEIGPKFGAQAYDSISTIFARQMLKATEGNFENLLRKVGVTDSAGPGFRRKIEDMFRENKEEIMRVMQSKKVWKDFMLAQLDRFATATSPNQPYNISDTVYRASEAKSKGPGSLRALLDGQKRLSDDKRKTREVRYYNTIIKLAMADALTRETYEIRLPASADPANQTSAQTTEPTAAQTTEPTAAQTTEPTAATPAATPARGDEEKIRLLKAFSSSEDGSEEESNAYSALWNSLSKDEKARWQKAEFSLNLQIFKNKILDSGQKQATPASGETAAAPAPKTNPLKTHRYGTGAGTKKGYGLCNYDHKSFNKKDIPAARLFCGDSEDSRRLGALEIQYLDYNFNIMKQLKDMGAKRVVQKESRINEQKPETAQQIFDEMRKEQSKYLTAKRNTDNHTHKKQLALINQRLDYFRAVEARMREINKDLPSLDPREQPDQAAASVAAPSTSASTGAAASAATSSKTVSRRQRRASGGGSVRRSTSYQQRLLQGLEGGPKTVKDLQLALKDYFENGGTGTKTFKAGPNKPDGKVAGETKGAIKKLQSELVKNEKLAAIDPKTRRSSIDGLYGPNTHAAVMKDKPELFSFLNSEQGKKAQEKINTIVTKIATETGQSEDQIRKSDTYKNFVVPGIEAVQKMEKTVEDWENDPEWQAAIAQLKALSNAYKKPTRRAAEKTLGDKTQESRAMNRLVNIINEEIDNILHEKRPKRKSYSRGLPGKRQRQDVLFKSINRGGGQDITIADINRALGVKTKKPNVYSPRTMRAIMRFQKKYRKQLGAKSKFNPKGGAKIDGLVGPNTFGVMTRVFPELKKLGDQKGMTVSGEESVLTALNKTVGAQKGPDRRKAFQNMIMNTPKEFYKFYSQLSKERIKYQLATDAERGFGGKSVKPAEKAKPKDGVRGKVQDVPLATRVGAAPVGIPSDLSDQLAALTGRSREDALKSARKKSRLNKEQKAPELSARQKSLGKSIADAAKSLQNQPEETANARSVRLRDELISDMRQTFAQTLNSLSMEIKNAAKQGKPEAVEKADKILQKIGQAALDSGDRKVLDLYREAMSDAMKSSDRFGQDPDRGYNYVTPKDIKRMVVYFYKQMKGAGSGRAPKFLKKLLYGNPQGHRILQRISKAYGKKEGETFMQWIDGEMRIPDVDKEKLRSILKDAPAAPQEIEYTVTDPETGQERKVTRKTDPFAGMDKKKRADYLANYKKKRAEDETRLDKNAPDRAASRVKNLQLQVRDAIMGNKSKSEIDALTKQLKAAEVELEKIKKLSGAN